MVDVQIKYGKSVIGTKHPESFGELSADQFIAITPYLLKERIEQVDRINMIMILLDLSPKQRSHLRFMPGYLVMELMKHHQWLFTEKSWNNWIIKEIPDFKLQIQNSKVPLYGPDDNWRNVCWDEFIYVDTWLMELCADEDTQFATALQDKIIATLFRPERKGYDPLATYSKGDRREDFNENTISFRAIEMTELDENIKLAILFNVKAVRHNLTMMYDAIFPHRDHEETREVNMRKRKNQSTWSHITRKLCDFADIDKVGKMPVHNVLFELNERIKESK